MPDNASYKIEIMMDRLTGWTQVLVRNLKWLRPASVALKAPGASGPPDKAERICDGTGNDESRQM